jgi:iron complex outermembrane receptor protein
LRAGASAELERLRIDPSTGAGLRARRTVGRADVGANLRVSDPLELGAIGALECHGTDGPNVTTRCDPFAPSGRLGVVAHVTSGLSVLGNVGESVRVPTLGELYGTSAFVLGNEDLKPERGIAADLGLRFSHRKSSFELWSEAFGFARRASDLIAYRRSSLGVVRPYNIGRARILGLELATGVDALHHLSAEANATLLDPRDVTPGRTLTNDLIPFQSRLVANGSFELYAEPTRVANRIAAGARASYRASRAADPAGLIIIAEQWLFGLDASASFWQRRLTTRIAVDNVFDRAHVDAIGYPLPGRSWHASGELWW